MIIKIIVVTCFTITLKIMMLLIIIIIIILVVNSVVIIIIHHKIGLSLI